MRELDTLTIIYVLSGAFLLSAIGIGLWELFMVRWKGKDRIKKSDE